MKLVVRNLTENRENPLPVYDMITSHGFLVSVFSLGASIQKIAFRSENGAETVVALGSSDPEFYRNLVCYAGATLAPNAGRIRGGELTLGGRRFFPAANEGANQLHGGSHALSGAVWSASEVSQTCEAASVLFTARLADGTDGWPGNRDFSVRYTLEDSGWLTVRFHAGTDAPTYVNMSSHTYWNLSGSFSHSALDQQLTVTANTVCLNNEEHLPTDILPVAGTVFDFRGGAVLRERLDARLSARDREQTRIARGYNHAFLLGRERGFRPARSARRPQGIRKACALSDPQSGRRLELYTDAPALVVYSGGFLPAGIPLTDGSFSSPSCALALEAQDVPDTPHFLPEALRLTTPEAPFSRTIRLRLF